MCLSNLSNIISKFVDFLMDILFPQKCLLCGKNISLSKHRYPLFCDNCISTVKTIPKGIVRCNRCSIPIEGRNTLYCDRCMVSNYTFRKNLSLYMYRDSKINRIFSLYKFSNRKQIAYFFADKVALFLYENFRGLPIIPVPPRWGKLKGLGWDHLGFIAEILRKKYGLPVFSILKRRRKTKPQKGLSLMERRENLREVFFINFRGREYKRFREYLQEIAKPYKVLIFDDIFTTGSTVDECSKTVINSGVEEVYAVTIAID